MLQIPEIQNVQCFHSMEDIANSELSSLSKDYKLQQSSLKSLSPMDSDNKSKEMQVRTQHSSFNFK
jgi:hypothetical protein